MKYAIDEFRVGRWQRGAECTPYEFFDTWAEADKFMDRLLGFFPLRQFRIVEVKEAESIKPDLPESSRSSHYS